jgi:integral membrane sensor domain MASE1/anti-sigma regulatory factor (Ser/Thr protein kinase)/GAF domain-containing protein
VQPLPRHPWARGAAVFVLVASGYVVGYKLAQNWFSASDQGASFFPPAGLTLATLVLVRRRSWPFVLAAAASAEVTLDLWNGTHIAACFGYALANTLEPLVGASLLLAAVKRPDLRRTRHLAAFLTSAVILAPIVGGTIAATTFVLDGHSGWLRFATEWWSGDGLGVLVVGGAMLSLRPWPPVSRRRALEGLVLGIATVGATTAVFEHGWFPFVYVPIALLIVIAFRVGTAGVAVIGAVAAFVAAGATAEADDFWAAIDVSPANRILYLQLAMAIVIAAVLALAAEIAERELVVAELARTEAERVTAMQRAELAEIEREARVRAEILAGHANRLAAATTAREVALAALSDLGSIGVTRGWVQRLVGDHLELLETTATNEANIRRYATIDLAATTPSAEAARLGEVVYVRNAAEHDERFPDSVFGRTHQHFESLVSIPLLEARGQTLGVLTLTSVQKDWLDEDRRQLVVAVAEQCGLALGRAFYQEEADLGAADAALLARLGEALERPTTMADRAQALAHVLVVERGASLAAVHALGERGPAHLIALVDAGASTAAIPHEEIDALAEAAIAEGGVQVRSFGDLDVFVSPLRARGHALGALAVAAPPRGRARLTTVLIERVATRAALALDNALLYEQERAVSHSLQLSLLGAEPSAIPNTAIATAYRPGTATLEVGGDWFDAFTLSGGKLAMLVGDVVGHGLEAAMAMGQLRGAVRALAPLGTPAQVIDGLDLFVEQLPSAAMATLAYAELDLETGTIVYACAGHPPPLLVPPSGEPRLLWEGRSPPLGSSFIRDRRDAVDQLESGDTIVLYTDGLIESRTEGIASGLDALVSAAREKQGSPPSELIERILGALLADKTQEDDVCVLAVARSVPAVRFTHAFPATPVAVVDMRRALAAWLDEIGLEPERQQYALLAASEAAANAAEHGYDFDGVSLVRVEAWVADGELQFSVRDEGTWRDPEPNTDRGRGRTIMSALMADVKVDSHRGGTVVRMSLPMSDEVPA